MIRTKRKRLTLGLAALMTAMMLGSCQGNGESGSKVKLSFQVWGTAQQNGMEVIANVYMEKHPDVEINVQVISWDKYWTKLDATAEPNQLPNIFWMHTNQILRHTDYGMLADVTDLYDDVDRDYYTKRFSEISLGDTKSSDGRLYGVSEDKDSVCLAYNREMFDAAGVVCPDGTWTWDDLTAASAKIYENTGKYGLMTYVDGQLDYWDFIYQAGGYILNGDKTKAGFMGEGTRGGVEFYVDLQKEPWCPDQNYFAETNPGTAFASEQGAMYLEGSWNLMSTIESNKDVVERWNMAILPKCPDPIRGDGRASTSNGLRYTTDARGKKLGYAKDFLKFAGSKEGQRVQGLSGMTTPAYIGLEGIWIHTFDEFDYVLDVQKCVDMLEYGVQSASSVSRPNQKTQINDALLKAYNGQQSLDEGLAAMQKLVDEAKQP